MPTNIGLEAELVYQKHLDAETIEEKIRTLEEFISLVPKHKGTEKLLATHRGRLVKLRAQLERQKKAGARTAEPFSIKKEEDSQIVLIGVRGSGRSMLLNALTGAQVPVGEFTQLPKVGVYEAKNLGGVRFQVVESPAIVEGASQGAANGLQILGLIRNTDLVCLCVDLSMDPEWQMDILLKEVDTADIKLNTQPPRVKIKRGGSGGIQVFGVEKTSITKEDLVSFLKSAGLTNVTVEIEENVSLNDIGEALKARTVYKKAVIVAMKGDMPGSLKNYEIIREKYGERFPLIPISAKTGEGIGKIGEEAFQILQMIRVYTKNQQGEVSKRPLVLSHGATVADAAKKIHKDFLKQFKSALVFREEDKVLKKQVGTEYILRDGDILQIRVT